MVGDGDNMDQMPLKTDDLSVCLVADSGDVNAVCSTPRHAIASKFCNKHANMQVYQNVIQVLMQKKHCMETEREKMKREKWRTHAGVMQLCEHAA